MMNILQIYIDRIRARRIIKRIDENDHFYVDRAIGYLSSKGMTHDRIEKQSSIVFYIGSTPVFRYGFKQFDDKSKWVLYGYGKIVHITRNIEIINEIKQRLLL